MVSVLLVFLSSPIVGGSKQTSVLLISFALQPLLLQSEVTAHSTHDFLPKKSPTRVDAVLSGRSAEDSRGLRHPTMHQACSVGFRVSVYWF